jgi:GTP cyclohydrolase I
MCVASRGVGDTNSKTGTAYFSGKFKDQNVKKEFLNYVNVSKRRFSTYSVEPLFF